MRARRAATRWPIGLLAALGLGAWAAQPPGPPDPEAVRHNNLGVALMDAGVKDPRYFAEAVREFEAALRRAPGDRRAAINLGMAYYYAGQGERARAALLALGREAPEDPHANYMLGLLEEGAGRYGEARSHFLSVTRRDPADPDAWYHLGFCGARLGRHEEAVEAFRKAVALIPYRRAYRYNLFMALSRAGRKQEAAGELESFRKLEASSVRVVDAPRNTLEYLKQGRYAEALGHEPVAAPPPPRPPRYRDVASSLGLGFLHHGTSGDPEVRAVLQGQRKPRSWFTDPRNQARVMAGVGAGAAFCDFNGDGRYDVVATDVNGRHAVFLQTREGRFEDVSARSAIGRRPRLGMSLACGDYDNDGWTDLLLAGYGEVRLLRNVEGRFRDVTLRSGLGRAVPSTTWATGAAFADVDHDGDLDAYLATFVDWGRLPDEAELRFPDDFPGQPNLLFRNNLDGTFTEVAREAGADGGAARTLGVWFADVNDDRAIDFVLLEGAGRVRTFLNRKDGSFAASSERPAGLPEAVLGEARAYADFNGDGAVDELLLRNGAVLSLNRNQTVPRNWLTVRVKGYAAPGKLKSNRSGIGTKVEVRSVGRWARTEVRAGNGRMGGDAPEAYFDLGEETRVDYVRAVFPSGVRWTLRDVPANQTVTLEEPLLDVNSCPVLFAWNGGRFEFVTDTISAGILGELVAPGQYWQPDPDEWVRITADQLRPRGQGGLELRFVNPLEEVTYLDRVALVAVDHPAGVAVYPDERMVGDAKDRGPNQVYALKDLRTVRRATDQHGHDVTARLRRQDRRYFEDFRPQPFKGFAEEWSLTLDLGELPAGAWPVLLLHGWSYWNSSASVLAAAQAGRSLWGPVLEVRQRDGGWRTGTDDMGVSAGLPRTILVDLSGMLRPGEHVIRIRSNRMLYFDQVLVAQTSERHALDGTRGSASMPLRPVPLRSAELRWLGYPRRLLPDGRLPEVLDYHRPDPEAEWSRHQGLFTRYGDVLPLLKAGDDELVVMDHGEEVALSFEGAALPAVPAGWKRTFLFYAEGYEKGHELHAGASATVEPLPVRGMGAYPYPGPYPEDERHLGYLVDWNTRPGGLRP